MSKKVTKAINDVKSGRRHSRTVTTSNGYTYHVERVGNKVTITEYDDSYQWVNQWER